MKSIFLSMLAIAALASCTKENFNVDPPGPKGKEMVVELTINGNSLSSKAGGATTDNADKVIKNITVFGVQTSTGAIITRKYFASGDMQAEGAEGAQKVAFATTDQTTQIHVIANIGEDLTGNSKALNLNTLKQLQNAKASLIVPADKTPKQTQGDVLMSGSTTTVTPGGEGGNASAAVTLNFIGSKIVLKSLVRSATSLGTYDTHFKLQNAIITHVQTNAYYVRGTDSYIDAITGDVRPAMTPLEFVTGRSGQTETKVLDFNHEITGVTQFDETHPVEDIAYWYVFENSDATIHTTLLIEYGWKKMKDDAGFQTMYFPVTFGAGDKPLIQPGKSYTVKLTFNGDFRPTDLGGGSGGGGTEDPDTPIVPGTVDVTVTPAAWTTENTPKPF